ncbi:8654_t:CDS:1, partial [Funneliformis geosporum]
RNNVSCTAASRPTRQITRRSSLRRSRATLAHMGQTITSRRPVSFSLLIALEANLILRSDVNTLLEVEVNAIPLSNAENSVEIPQEKTK